MRHDRFQPIAVRSVVSQMSPVHETPDPKEPSNEHTILRSRAERSGISDGWCIHTCPWLRLPHPAHDQDGHANLWGICPGASDAA